MNLPTDYNVTGKTLNACTKTQTAFVRFLYEAGFTTKDDVVFNRTYLTTLANSHGVTWPPAWIVKDVSRCVRRGYYAVPELNDYIVEMAETSVITTDVSPGHGHEGDELSDTIHDDMDETINVSDDMMATMPM
jgi:hypothetical protein